MLTFGVRVRLGLIVDEETPCLCLENGGDEEGPICLCWWKERRLGARNAPCTCVWGEHVSMRPARVRPGINDEDMNCMKKQDN